MFLVLRILVTILIAIVIGRLVSHFRLPSVLGWNPSYNSLSEE